MDMLHDMVCTSEIGGQDTCESWDSRGLEWGVVLQTCHLGLQMCSCTGQT